MADSAGLIIGIIIFLILLAAAGGGFYYWYYYVRSGSASVSQPVSTYVPATQATQQAQTTLQQSTAAVTVKPVPVSTPTAAVILPPVPTTPAAPAKDCSNPESYYLNKYPDIAANVASGSGFVCGEDHWASGGYAEGRDSCWPVPPAPYTAPCKAAKLAATPVKDCSNPERYYLNKYPDVAANVASGVGFVCGEDHWASNGYAEGRDSCWPKPSAPYTAPCKAAKLASSGSSSSAGIKPRRTGIQDCGYVDNVQGWYDVQHQGAPNDFCRNLGPGGPYNDTWISCVLAGGSSQDPFADHGKYTTSNIGPRAQAGGCQ